MITKNELQAIFSEWQEKANADYATVFTDNYGDCNSCVNAELTDEFGTESTGIFLKYWEHGMNKSPINFEESDEFAIGHDITEEQAEKLIETFSQYFHVFPKEYDPSRAFLIMDPEKDIYKLSYKNETNQINAVVNYYSNYDAAKNFGDYLENKTDCFDINIELIEKSFKTMEKSEAVKDKKKELEKPIEIDL